MVVFVQVLGEIEERSKRLEDAPPPPAVSFIEPPPPMSLPRVADLQVTAAYRKTRSSATIAADFPPSNGEETKASIADAGIERAFDATEAL